ncbi:MAG: ORF6N domain-containing protein [Bacilli bacterium]|nr:ORF6N domain-containing protein [Bacilli bacterium]
MNEIKEIEHIENIIYEIRGKQVMFDCDLARLYQCKNGTKEINQAVKNNIEKFPERFSWRLTEEDVKFLRSKKLTTTFSNKSRSTPRVFTEQGVAMLATIIKSKIATEISINIMDAFVAMKKYISSDLLEQKYINNQVLKNTEDIKILQESFNKIKDTDGLFFKDQIYDSYSLLLDIFNMAEK